MLPKNQKIARGKTTKSTQIHLKYVCWVQNKPSPFFLKKFHIQHPSCPRGLTGCFRKWWYPQIIHLNRVFHYKLSISGYLYFWKHPTKEASKVFPPRESTQGDLGATCQIIGQLCQFAGWLWGGGECGACTELWANKKKHTNPPGVAAGLENGDFWDSPGAANLVSAC